MTYKIRFTEKAEKDIETIYDFIKFEYQAEETAKSTVKTIVETIETLSTFPLRCPPFRLNHCYRVLFSGSYNVIFEIDTDTVNVVSVLPSIFIH